MSSKFVSDVTADTFREEVLESKIPVAVDFWAPWCGPCLQVATFFERLATDLCGLAKFVKLNVDGEPEKDVARSLGITNIPTLKLFKNGKAVLTFVGTDGIQTGKEKLVEVLK